MNADCNNKYKPYIVKHNSINDFIKMYFLHCFVQHASALIMSHLQVDQTLYYPTNAHNVKNLELLIHIKIMEAGPTCFGLQRNHHQGATASA